MQPPLTWPASSVRTSASTARNALFGRLVVSSERLAKGLERDLDSVVCRIDKCIWYPVHRSFRSLRRGKVVRPR